MRWIGTGSVRDEAQTRANIEAMERLWEAEGFGLFAVEIRGTCALAGFTGLAVPDFLPDFLPEVVPAVEVGRRLGRAFWGRGPATEAPPPPAASWLRTVRWPPRRPSLPARAAPHARSGHRADGSPAPVPGRVTVKAWA